VAELHTQRKCLSMRVNFDSQDRNCFNHSKFCISRSRLKFYGDRAFSVCAPKLWNNLPEHIKCSPNRRTFKSSLKTHLFKYYFNL